MKKNLCFFLIFFAFSSFLTASTGIPKGLEVTQDVPYSNDTNVLKKMDIVKSSDKKTSPSPVIIFIHGGGWQNGDKSGGLLWLFPFALKGYFCTAINYRLSNEAPFPAQIEDVKCAVRFLRSKAKEYNINPDKIGVFGHSAGGHLAALLGTSGDIKDLEETGGYNEFSSRVQAAADLSGPTDFIRLNPVMLKDKNSYVSKFLGGTLENKKALAVKANPLTHISKDDPPFLIIHGNKDNVIPENQSKALYKALKDAGLTVDLKILEGKNHNIRCDEADKLLMDFFEKNLK